MKRPRIHDISDSNLMDSSWIKSKIHYLGKHVGSLIKISKNAIYATWRKYVVKIELEELFQRDASAWMILNVGFVFTSGHLRSISDWLLEFWKLN